MVFIEINRLSKYYKDFCALRQITYIQEKEGNIAILGPNGSGKSTLLKILSGILHPSEGEVKVFGFRPYEKKKSYLLKISYVNPQKTRLIFDVSAMDNLYLFGSAYGLSFKEIKTRAEKLSTMLGVEHKLQSPVRNLSFGERVKIELITALLHAPDLLLLDEPFVGLDFMARKTLQDLFVQTKTNVIITSHLIDGLTSFVENVILLNRGEVVYAGKLERMYERVKGKKTVILYVNDETIYLPGFIKRGKWEYGALVEEDKIGDLYSSLVSNSSIEKIEIRSPEIEDIIGELLFG
uniref:ATP-binding cassette domain-containing protein n=1 Tax=candidate division WOR-3 bacterium TaxID=2052148 RepID=A0A7V4E3Y0_UNCW3